MEPIDNLFELEPWKSEHPTSAQITSQIWNPDMTDEIMQGYPQSLSVIAARKNNSSILWDPSILTGMPALARGNLESNPIFLILSSFLALPDAINWTRILGLFLAGVFTFIFLRELGSGIFGALVGGLAFSFNAYLVSWLSLVFFFSAMIWLPLIFWGIERACRRRDWRWALLGGLGFTLQILSGSILFSFFSAVTVLLFYAYRSLSDWIGSRAYKSALQPLLHTLIALGFGALLAAPQLLLVIELYFHSRRDTPIGAGSFLDPWTHLIRLIAPRIYGDNIHGQVYQSVFNFPETNLYLGIIPLFFILFSLKGPHRKIAWGFLVIGTISLLAVYSAPIRQIVRLIYPLMLHTFPGRIFFIVVFCFSVTAGLGADALSSALIVDCFAYPRYLQHCFC